MRKLHLITGMVLMAMSLNAQETTIEKPESGQTQYTVTGSETLEATEYILFKDLTSIQPGTGHTFIARIEEGNVPTNPYATSVFSDENYIFTRSYQAPYQQSIDIVLTGVKEADIFEDITYFDGLGRPMQQIGIKATPGYNDLVTHIGYGDFGRQEKEWLPYSEPTGSSGSYRGDRSTATNQYYMDNYGSDFPNIANVADINAFAQKEFENSPLNRVMKQAAPGEDWKLGNGHEIELDYLTNIANEVRLFNVASDGTLNNVGHYAAGELYKNVTRDEDHEGLEKDHTVEEFIDKEGRQVLTRKYNAGVAHDTHYVYDDHGNLAYVLPPKVTTSSVSTEELDGLCYQYKYDHRNRLVEKKQPGKGWEYIVYNKLNQPIMTQDANMRKENNPDLTIDEWVFTKYDIFGRVAYTGMVENDASRTSIQNSANTVATPWVKPTNGYILIDNLNVYYTNDGYPGTGYKELHTVNYYDTYDTARDDMPTGVTSFGINSSTNARGLATVSLVKVLGTTSYITTATYYDQKGRAIYTHTKNPYLDSEDIVETKLDFAGKVLRTKTTHKKEDNPDIVTEEVYIYDHQGRLLRQKQTINSQPQELLVDNTYDELGQLTNKQVGGGLQSVDYGYNIRGWLKNINNTSSLGNDLFAFDINYNTVDHAGTALFNGNISETEWKTANDAISDNRWYRYTYDALNRITSASGPNANYNLSNVTYDKNGNILTLTRRGHTNNSATAFGIMDDLIYTYTDNSNELFNILDEANITQGFRDLHQGTTVGEYAYDENGNMIKDNNKGVKAVEYNHLNLPVRVIKNPAGGFSNYIAYTYDALGNKLQKRVYKFNISETTTQYANGYVYEKHQSLGLPPPGQPAPKFRLQFFSHLEGYVSAKDQDDYTQGFNYVYQYKDHLGNVRLSYADSNNDGTIDASTEIIEESNYYPFGMKHRGYNDVISPNGNSTAQKWKFQGVELEESLGLNLYEMDFRQYDPSTGRFMSIDPLAEERDWLTPYNFVQNNPLTRIDPSGLLDDFVLNEDGTLTKIAETDTADRIFAQDSNGDVIEDEFVTLEKDEQIESNPEKRARTTSGEEFNFQIIPFEDSAVAAEVFEFVSDNSEVEFAQVDTELGSTVSTSFFKGRDKSQGISIRRFIKDGAKNIFARHSHPRNSDELLQAAAGLGRISQTPSDGDIRNAQSRAKEFPGVNFRFQVYDPIFSTNYNYNAQGFQKKVPTIQKPVKL